MHYRLYKNMLDAPHNGARILIFPGPTHSAPGYEPLYGPPRCGIIKALTNWVDGEYRGYQFWLGKNADGDLDLVSWEY